jgi:hypothetical protein
MNIKIYMNKNYISLGIQCAFLLALQAENMRIIAYPFDWNFVPIKQSYKMIKILLTKNIDSVVKYMTTGYKYYDANEFNKFTLSKNITTPEQFKNKFKKWFFFAQIAQSNPITGISIMHYIINKKYKNKLKDRFKRLLDKIYSNEQLIFIYIDTLDNNFNYYIDGKCFDKNATTYLRKIYNLIYPINYNIQILYFCRKEHYINDDKFITYIPFTCKDYPEFSINLQNYLNSVIKHSNFPIIPKKFNNYI